MVEISTLSQSNYLKAEDLNGQNTDVSIRSAVLENVGNPPEQKLVVFFNEFAKGLICNKTNLETIADELGQTDTDHWAGGRLTLTAKIVEYGGSKTLGLRVMDKWDRQSGHQCAVDPSHASNQAGAQDQNNPRPQQNMQQNTQQVPHGQQPYGGQNYQQQPDPQAPINQGQQPNGPNDYYQDDPGFAGQPANQVRNG